MNTRPVIRALALGAILLPAALLAAGCSSVIDVVVHHQQDLTFEDRAAMKEGWNRFEEWVPADATHIIGTAGTDGPHAAIMFRSEEDLDPAVCAEVPRRSAPVYALKDAPAVYEMDKVFACGDWSVVRTDDGWLGWTPNAPDEAAESPAS